MIRDKQHPAVARLLAEGAGEEAETRLPEAIQKALHRTRKRRYLRYGALIARRSSPVAKQAQAALIRSSTLKGMEQLFDRDPSAIGWSAQEVTTSLFFDRAAIYGTRGPTRNTLLAIVRTLFPKHWGSIAKRRREARGLILNKRLP